MGGLLILTAAIGPTLLWADLTNEFVWIAVLTTLGFAAVGLVDEALKLPDGLNTMLQTNGAPLSTTQALRLMLARAIVGRPRLLLIDGTLDGLSDEMQQMLLAHLLGPDRPWTALIATGRQAVIDRCDQVVTLGRNAVPADDEG